VKTEILNSHFIFLCQAVVSLRHHAKWFRFVCRRTSARCSWNADWGL